MTLQPEIEPSAQRKAMYRREGHWGDATLLDYWNMAVLSQPCKTAVVDSRGARVSYADLDERATRLAGWFRANGLERGDVVSIQLPGWAEFTLVYVACLKAGAVVNLIIPAYRGRELAYLVNKCRPRFLIMPYLFRRFNYVSLGRSVQQNHDGDLTVIHVDKDGEAEPGVLTLSSILEGDCPALVNPGGASADDVAAVLFTSGTESMPKGVLLTHNNIIASIRPFAARLNLNSRDIMFMPSPVGHATGFHHGVTTPFLLGGTSVLQDIFKPDEALQIIARERCTYGMGAAPFVYDLSCAMERVPYDFSSLRFFLCGGAPSPRHLLDALWEKGFRVINVYGSTESVPHTVSSPSSDCALQFMTDGRPVDGCEVRVVDKDHKPVPPCVEGEEASRGPNVFVGYLGEPELTRAALDEDGWYYSGDLCVMNEAGDVRIVGRKKDIVVRGGENISSLEVEGILLEHPLVAEAAVVGMPDPRLGERVCAFVVTRGKLELADVVAFFCQHCVAKCKYPERLEVVDAIPRNPVGKVRKNELRKRIADTLRREGVDLDGASCAPTAAAAARCQE